MRLLVVDDEVDLADAMARGPSARGLRGRRRLRRRRGPRAGSASPPTTCLPRPHHARHRRPRGLPAAARPTRRTRPDRRTPRRVPDAHGPRLHRRPGRRASTPAPTTTSSSRSPSPSSRPGCGRCCAATPAAPAPCSRSASSARHGPLRGAAGRPGPRPHGQGVRAAALLHEPRRRGPVAGAPARARVGRARRPVHQHGAGQRSARCGASWPRATRTQLIETVIGRGYRLRRAGARVTPRARRPPPAEATPGRPAARAHGAGVGRALPEWMGSIRFRLTALYSLFLFGLAAIVVGGIYIGCLDALARRAGVAVDGQDGRDSSDGETATASTVRTIAGRSSSGSTSASLAAAAQLLVRRPRAAVHRQPRRRLGRGRPGARPDRPHHRRRPRDPGHRPVAPHRPRRAHPTSSKNLADTFDEMLARLDDAFESQRRFIHEASHELRNPLAVIRTNLDVALADRDAIAEDLRQTGEVVRRTGGAHVAPRRRPARPTPARERPCASSSGVDAAAVVADAAAEFEVPAEARGHRARVGRRAGPVGRSATASPCARRWPTCSPTRCGWPRRARPSAWPPAGRARGRRADRGSGSRSRTRARASPKTSASMVFQRFWRGDGRRAREEGRSGLGLTIVRQIAESHRGRSGWRRQPGRRVDLLALAPRRRPAAPNGLAPLAPTFRSSLRTRFRRRGPYRSAPWPVVPHATGPRQEDQMDYIRSTRRPGAATARRALVPGIPPPAPADDLRPRPPGRSATPSGAVGPGGGGSWPPSSSRS